MLLLIFPYQTFAIDTIKIKNQRFSENKSQHNIAVIKRALELTEAEFGEFTLETVKIKMTSDREIKLVEKGEILNVTITPANALWDQTITPIRVPIRQGLLSYRLLVINKVDLPVYEKISTLEDLKQVKAGLLHGWKTIGIYKDNKMPMVKTNNYEGMFQMLNKGRFDYIPRASYEVFDELESQKELLVDIVVEPTIALLIPTLTYVYVSPTSPNIAKRLEKGLRRMSANGELKTLLNKYFGKDIEKANLGKRKIISLENNYLNHHVNLSDTTILHGN